MGHFCQQTQHEKTCPHRPQPCPACGTGVPRVLMEQHQELECPQRKVRCEHCLSEIFAASKEVGKQEHDVNYCPLGISVRYWTALVTKLVECNPSGSLGR